MKPVRATLIDLFSRLPCAVIEDGAAKIVQAFDADSFAGVAALPQYAEEYNRVRTAKRQLERIEATYSSANGDQALQSLCLLKDLRAQTKYINDDYLVTRELIASPL